MNDGRPCGVIYRGAAIIYNGSTLALNITAMMLAKAFWNQEDENNGE
jgi:hypothetical protein